MIPQTIEDFLANLEVDCTAPSSEQSVEVMHNLIVVDDWGGPVVSCTECDCSWTIHFAWNEELGSHFVLEQVDGGDPLICTGNEDYDNPEGEGDENWQ